MSKQTDPGAIALYKIDAVACAKLCDEKLDPRGGLLGRVRRWVEEGQ